MKVLSKLTVPKFLSLGFLLLILLGTLLLMLPFATAEGESTSFLGALFTSTSATCVTGLVKYDTATHWTVFGEIVILCLIQIGGLGFMAFVSVLFEIFRKTMGLYERRVLMQSTGEKKSVGLRSLLRRIFIGTAFFEGLGAVFLASRFIPRFGVLRGIYYSVWHAVSAFCNAGFDLMGGKFGGAKFVSFTPFATDPVVTFTLSFLIIVGGIGFCVWSDLWDFVRGLFRKERVYLQLHTKVILFVTGLLLLFSTALFLLFEWKNPTYEGYSFFDRFLVSFFNAVSPRTAGFSTTDLTSLSNGGYLLTVILMFIGGSSGSTAGGVKVGTMAVIVMGMIAVFREKRDINVGKRRIEYSLMNQALAIFTSFLLLAMASTLLLCGLEPQLPFQDALFEVVSALGTVGLSLSSSTPLLSTPSSLLLILLMYAGRVGILTLILALGKKRVSSELRRPLDTILIG